MIILAFAIAGAGFGWFRAGKRGGNRMDRLHYAVAHAIAFALLGFIVSIVGARLTVA